MSRVHSSISDMNIIQVIIDANLYSLQALAADHLFYIPTKLGPKLTEFANEIHAELLRQKNLHSPQIRVYFRGFGG